MGLFKKYIEKMQANTPDHEAEVRKCLQPGEQWLGAAFATHSVGEAGGRKLLEVAVNSAIKAYQKNQHMGGEKGSCAFAVPRSGYFMVVISDQRVSFWDFGTMMSDLPPAEALAFPRSSVTSIMPTGETAPYALVNRFSFVDGSFVDMNVSEGPLYDGFRGAAASLAN